MQTRALSVIVPVWNNPIGVSKMIDSIRVQEVDGMEVVVIDKDRNELTSSICEKHGAMYISCPGGRSAAKNLGFRMSTGEFVLFLDSDMTVDEKAISICLKDAKKYDALCFREKVVTDDNYWAKARAIERNAMFGRDVFESARLIRRDVFRNVGGYDENLEGFEDLDLHARILELGYSIGWTNAIIFHHEGDVGIRSYLSKRKIYASGREIYAKRHPSRWKELTSLRSRFELIRAGMHDYNFLETLYLLPGLLLMRVLEILDFGFI
jgi:glycosyltransferase involved in cell wall biosynthesis